MPKLNERRKKPLAPPPELDPRQKQLAAGGPDTKGHSGEGSESILAHLRDFEKRRSGTPDKGGR